MQKSIRLKWIVVSFLVSVATGLVFPLRADTTIAWWRFNGDGTTVPNVANPGFLDGTIVSVSNTNKSSVTYDKVSYGSVAAQMPVRTANLQSVAPRMYDQRDGSVVSGGGTLSWQGESLQGGVKVDISSEEALTALRCGDTTTDSAGRFQVEAMIRIPTNALAKTEMMPIVSCGYGLAAAPDEGWVFGVTKGYLAAKVCWTNAPGGRSLASDSFTYYNTGMPDLRDGKWHHVAMRTPMKFSTSTASSNRFRIDFFLDGVQYSCPKSTSYNPMLELLFSGNYPLFIGADPCTSTRTFYGDIAEVRLSTFTGKSGDAFTGLVPLADGKGLADDDTALLLTFDNTKHFGCPTNQIVATRSSATATSDAYTWYDKHWNILNAAYSNPLLAYWEPYAANNSPSNTIDALRPQPTNDVHAAVMLAVSDSGSTTNALLNGSSLKFTPLLRNGNTAELGSDLIVVTNSQSLVTESGFTMEFTYRGNVPSTNTVTLLHCPYLRVMASYQGHLYVTIYKTSPYSGAGYFGTSKMIMNDGEWHHLAITYDGTSEFTFYIDHESVGTKTQAIFADAGATDGVFYIGTRARDSSSHFGFGRNSEVSADCEWELGAVRFTRRVLTADEFLQGADMPKRYHFSNFDGDTASSVASGVPDYLAANGVAGGSTLPSFVASRSGKVVLDGTNGTEKVAWGNAIDLSNGASVNFPRNVLLEQGGALTVEFFAKIDSFNSNRPALFSILYGDGTAGIGSSSNVFFTVYKVKSYDYLTWASRLSRDGGFSANPPSDLSYTSAYMVDQDADFYGKWHHHAFILEPLANGKTTLTHYLDYVQVKTSTFNKGNPYIPPEGLSVTIGGWYVTSSDKGVGKMTGVIDNFRITPGVLDPSEFMGSRDDTGFLFLIR